MRYTVKFEGRSAGREITGGSSIWIAQAKQSEQIGQGKIFLYFNGSRESAKSYWNFNGPTGTKTVVRVLKYV